MRRVWMVFVLIISIFVALKQVQAKEENNFKWHKVGDGLFELCELQFVYFVENVKDANEEKVSSISPEVKEKVDWKEIKMDVGLKKATMKKWENGKFEDVYDRLAYVDFEYEKGKRLYLKAVIDSGRKYVFSEENIETPIVYASRDREHFFFMDEEGIWKVLVPGIYYPDWGSKKLTRDTVNGKSMEDISKNLVEGDYVLWVHSPEMSSRGRYIAYVANKDSKSKGLKNILEIWLIDTLNQTDELLFNAKYTVVHGWVDDETLVYDLDKNVYLYNVVSKVRTFLISNSDILYIDENTVIYANRTNLNQIYIYDAIKQNIYKFPELPKNTKIHNGISYIHYALSTDGTKLLIFLTEKDAKTNEFVDALYLLDRETQMVTLINLPGNCEQSDRFYHISRWISDNEVIIYTIDNNGGKNVKTWILSLR